MKSSIGSARRGNPRIVAALLAALSVFGAVPLSSAQTDAEAFRDLATAPDYRLRVAAALNLGSSKSPGARLALERALGDAEPSVRAAASAALGAQGNAAALPALRAALAKETTVSVRAQLESTVARLGGAAVAVKARYLVALGKIENKSGASGAEVVSAFKHESKSRLAKVPGVEMAPEGADLVSVGKSKNLPVLTVDAALTALAKAQTPAGISYSARVEYVIRRMPDHTLKGTMSGNAKALAEHTEIRGNAQLQQLQIDAVAGAIDSALKGATPALDAAAQ